MQLSQMVCVWGGGAARYRGQGALAVNCNSQRRLSAVQGWSPCPVGQVAGHIHANCADDFAPGLVA